MTFKLRSGLQLSAKKIIFFVTYFKNVSSYWTNEFINQLKNNQMAAAILIPISFFIFLFATLYLYFTTRNKERMALIEKGAEASIFVQGRRKGSAPVWKVFILNLALLLVGIGLAIFIGSFMEYTLGVDGDIAYPGSIFLMAGIGLLTGFFITKKMEKED